MNQISIYHNPRCSKSRRALELLEEAGHNVRVIEYLNTPLNVEAVLDLIRMAGGDPMELVRVGEDEFADSGIPGNEQDVDVVAEAISRYPRLLQRPVVVCGMRAVVARPPESLSELINPAD